MAVSKTDFMRGMQCPKMLWLDKNHPELKVIPEEIQAVLDEGNDFGDEAMGLFGDYVEVTTYREDGRLDVGKMIEKTKECMESGTEVICEASFSYYGNYCAVDILRRVDGDCWEIYEVKNSPFVKQQFLRDVAFQKYILYKCGVKIKGCYVIIKGAAEGAKFEKVNVSREVAELYGYIDKNIWRLGKIKAQAEEVVEEVGEQCERPYRCWYWDYCHKKTDGETGEAG